MTDLPLPALPTGECSPTALTLPDGLSVDQWHEVGNRLSGARTAIQFWIGDWWNYGHSRYEHGRPYEIAGRVGLNYRTVENYASVCHAIESSRRREPLRFGHHAAVAALPTAEADALLDWACERVTIEGRAPSVFELRQKIAQWPRRARAIERQQPQGVIKMQVKHLPPRVIRLRFEHHDVPADFVGPLPTPPALDDSAGGGPLAPELAALAVEPLPAFDRVAAALAIVADMSREEWLQFWRRLSILREPPDDA